MDIKNRIQQSICHREGDILLRAGVEALGSHSQVSAALLELSADGAIEFLEKGVYALPVKLAVVAVETLRDEAH